MSKSHTQDWISKVLCLLLLIGTTTTLYSQSTLEWSENYGNNQNNLIYDIAQTDDNGYVTVGSTWTTNDAYDFWIQKTHPNGQVDWQETFGSSTTNELGYTIISTNDNAYLVAGYSPSGDNDILKISATGSIEWSQDLDDYAKVIPSKIIQTSNNDFYIAGTMAPSESAPTGGFGHADFVLTKLESNGSVDWQKNYGGSKVDQLKGMTETTDGGFVLTGSSLSDDGMVGSNEGLQDGWLLKVNAQGSHQWFKSYGSSYTDIFNDVQLTSDGGFILAGYSDEPDSGGFTGDADFWIIKTNSNGNLVWEKKIDLGDVNYATSVQEDQEGGYLVAGYSKTSNDGFDYQLVKLSETGNEEWTQTYGGGANDVLRTMKKTTDNGFVLAGYSNSTNDDVPYNYGCVDGFVIKLEGKGIVLSLGSNQSICENSTIGLDATIPNCPDCMYLWSNGSNDPTPAVMPLETTNYQVTVTDLAGQTATDNITIMVNPLPTVSSNITNVACAGDTNGSIDLNASGGSGGYIYNWNNGESTQDLEGLTGGNYEVTVTDSNGCDQIAELTVEGPAPLDLNVDANNVSCFGANDGSIDLTVDGGSGNYDYEWSNGDNSQDLNSLSSGNYEVTITDSNNCEQTTSANINAPSALNLNIDPTNVSCFGLENGHINLTVNGGAGDYTFDWSNGATAQSINELPAGNYEVTVTDENNCNETISATIDMPTEIDINKQTNAASCVGVGNGSIELIVDGGAGNYSYEWSTGSNNQNINGLEAGTYEVTVTDSNNCNQITSATVDSDYALQLSTATNSVSCFGLEDGNVEVMPSGGMGDYTYQWSTGSNNQSIDGLAAGSYEVTVTDGNNCMETIEATIETPSALDLNIDPSAVSCFGSNNGSINLTVDGGDGNYTYEWSNGVNDQDLISLEAGPYQVTITYDGNCEQTISTTVETPSALNLNTNSNDITCFGLTNGSIDLSASGGVENYSYAWSNGETTQNVEALSVGTYEVTVTDGNNCDITTTAMVEMPTEIDLNTEINATSCEGVENGNINLMVDGGVGNYSYEWSNGETTQNINGLEEGTYEVTVSDGNNCNQTTSVTVDIAYALDLTVVENDANCFDLENGSIDLMVDGGPGNYNYQWSNGETTQNINGLQSGIYEVTVTDSNNCMETTTAIIETPAALDLNIDANAVSCFGSTNGSINLTVDGGDGNYSYEWSNGEDTQDINGLEAGPYQVTITFDGTCDQTVSTNIESPAALDLNIDGTDITCFGLTNGTINLSASGGVENYSYAWSNGETTQNVEALSEGVYEVTVSDGNNCNETISTTIEMPAAIDLNTTVNATSCLGVENGSIDLMVEGGVGNYNYEWNTGANSQNINGLESGTYEVTVTDGNNCIETLSTTVEIEYALDLTTAVNDVSCFNYNNGSIELMVDGGDGSYTYNWSNGENSQNINGLIAGTYEVTVTDNNNCIETITTTVETPEALTLNIDASPVNCFGFTNGNIDLVVNGGTENYSYLWNNGETTQNLNAIEAGAYEVTVTDANECIQTISTTVETPSALDLNIAGVDITCFGLQDGSIDLMVDGGVGNYSYAWSNGETTQNVEALSEGVYEVTVTDGNNCNEIITTTIEMPAAINLTTEISATSCVGVENGSIELIVNGGVGNYSYEWSNGATSQNLNALSLGTYDVTVSDANDCIETTSATIDIAYALDLDVVATDISCFGFGNGNIDLMTDGGDGDYSYEWSNGETTQNINGLETGTYEVTVTDGDNCMETISATIETPAALDLNIDANPVSCFGSNNGDVELIVNGGVENYSYEWSNGEMTQNLTTLETGSYQVTVTDANNCIATATTTVATPSLIEISIAPNDITCFGFGNGNIGLVVNGGVGGYSYLWSNGETTQNIEALEVGVYEVTVTDANNCDQIIATTIETPAAMALNTDANPVSCFGSNNGSIDLMVEGGIENYSYEWSNGETTQNISTLETGTYEVTVTDANNCDQAITATVETPTILELNIAPNDISCFGLENGNIDLMVEGGIENYSYEWSNGDTTQNIMALEVGAYEVTVTDANDCIQTATTAIEMPTALELSITSNDITCFGFGNGNIELMAEGGVGNYTYEWTNGDTTQNITALEAGGYVVTVTDANNCTLTATDTIETPSAIDLNIAENDITCFGLIDGSIDLIVDGGVGNYSYEWSNGETTQSIDSLSIGTYEVVVTDGDNCTATMTTMIESPAVLDLNAQANDVTCAELANGNIILITSGGIEDYLYEWSNGDSTQNVYSLAPGTYQVTVTDANQCTQTTEASITEPAPMSLVLEATNVSCYEAADGSLELEVIGGVGDYTFDWSNDETTEDLDGLDAGGYSVLVQDGNGCNILTSAIVFEPAPLVVNVDAIIPTGGLDNGSIDLQIVGGTPIDIDTYEVNWSNGATGTFLENLAAGNYSFTVTDNNGCTFEELINLIPNAINDLDGVTRFEVYPNPTNGFTQIDLQFETNIDFEVRVFSAIGQIVVQQYFYKEKEKQIELDLSRFAAGLYFIEVSNANGRLSKKLIRL